MITLSGTLDSFAGTKQHGGEAIMTLQLVGSGGKTLKVEFETPAGAGPEGWDGAVTFTGKRENHDNPPELASLPPSPLSSLYSARISWAASGACVPVYMSPHCRREGGGWGEEEEEN